MKSEEIFQYNGKIVVALSVRGEDTDKATGIVDNNTFYIISLRHPNDYDGSNYRVDLVAVQPQYVSGMREPENVGAIEQEILNAFMKRKPEVTITLPIRVKE